MFPGHTFLKFQCTGCGNCCKDPLLPLTDEDVRRIARRTGDRPKDIVTWVDRHGIDMDDEPEAFVRLRQGKRAMVLRHSNGGCRYLGEDRRCSIYSSRPLGCRVYPFDPVFGKTGKLRRLTIVKATPCPYKLEGKTSIVELRDLHGRYSDAHDAYNDKVADWNRLQERRTRKGLSAQTAHEFFVFLGLESAAIETTAAP